MDSKGVRVRAARLAGGALARGLLTLVIAGCAGAPQAQAWERLDLTAEPPRVVAGPRGAWQATLGFQGPEEVRDLRQIDARKLALAPALRPPRVRVLRQQAGSLLSWRVELGSEPYVAFTPLPSSVRCRPAGEVSVGEPGEARTRLWTMQAASAQALPAEVVLPLARWAGREVDLRFGVPGGGCATDWGSPEVVSRRQSVLPRPRAGGGGRPNVLLIGADTLRADALGAWGRSPSLTPALDALAAESDVWLEAFSTSNATTPSFASILTGLHAHRHGVLDLDTALPAEHVTLAERLGAAGYETLAVLAAQHIRAERSGLGQGFDEVVDAENTSAARLAVNQAMAWLERERTEPFFVWLHLFDPHTPHTPPAPFALGMRAARPYGLSRVVEWARFRAPGARAFSEPLLAAHRDLYDGEVAYLDREVDRLLGFLRDRGLLANTVVAFVGDHGENLGDHGVRFRHSGLWDTTTHVPLMIRWPGERRDGQRFRGLVQTLDLYPTLLAAARLKPGDQDGRDLRALTGEGRQGRRAVFAMQADGSGASVRTRTARFFSSRDSRIVPAGDYLYDLVADPGELVNLAGGGRPEEAELRELLRRWRAHGGAKGARGRTDAETDAELRALGYL